MADLSDTRVYGSISITDGLKARGEVDLSNATVKGIGITNASKTITQKDLVVFEAAGFAVVDQDGDVAIRVDQTEKTVYIGKSYTLIN